MGNAGRADVAIRGAGLAGILLAHAIERLGGTAVLADDDRPNAASPMAPGIINPLAGRKFKVNTDYAETHTETLGTFAELEERFGRTFWHPMPLIRFIEQPAQADFLEERAADDEATDWLGRRFAPGAHGPHFQDPHGSFETRGAGWLDVAGLMEAARGPDGFTFVPPEALPEAAPVLVDCRGWRCQEDPRWAGLPWKCARGEVMTVAVEEALPRHLWNGGGWLQPLPDGNWRAGATYAWSQFEAPPLLTAQAELIGKLRRWMRAPFRILEQKAGVRAVVIDYRPVLGAFSDEPRRMIFSGLGSHGAIQGAPYAALLAEHVLNGRPLPSAVAVERFAS